jgi:predicted acylesterase/phospholipase RssA
MNNPPENYGVEINHEIWKVCRATTAAQFYFESQKIGDEEFCDGGVGVNNPTKKALEEMRSLHKANLEVVASFGTGKWEPPSMFRAGNASRLHLGPAITHVNRLLKNAKGALTECEKTHEFVQSLANDLRDTVKEFKYFRFNVDEDLGKVKMNEWEDRRDDGDKGKCSTLEYIRKCTEKELSKPQVQERLRELATLLVAQRRKRIKDDPDMWARFASCVRYKCAADDCRIAGEIRYFPIRREMREHLRSVHNTQSELMEAELDRCQKWPDFPTGPF